jgi:class 3 adenylate cyclase
MSYGLFEHEEAVIAAGRALLEGDGPAGPRMRSAYRELLREYEKLLRVTRRLMRLSDRNERELNALAENHRVVAEEIARKSAEVEALSSKLSKYLPPQVYASIFSGRQEVKITSQRKKLTVFFSDLADFTETTEKLESEDLTQLLNHYLTEMSKVALEYGATIDKYIGDAILIFFGDPETRGVREDALACVKMAIAMQKRMRELEGIWREAGVEEPLRARMGISTGYCTVGNFGSEDRMDYTIIGSAANLASRLEHEARPGTILISYETHAHVKDKVHCEERGHVEIKGIPYPVAIYRVVDLYSSFDESRRIVREDHPGIKVELDLDALSEGERHDVAELLRRVLDRVTASNPTAGSRGGDGRIGRTVR